MFYWELMGTRYTKYQKNGWKMLFWLENEKIYIVDRRGIRTCVTTRLVLAYLLRTTNIIPLLTFIYVDTMASIGMELKTDLTSDWVDAAISSICIDTLLIACTWISKFTFIDICLCMRHIRLEREDEIEFLLNFLRIHLEIEKEMCFYVHNFSIIFHLSAANTISWYRRKITLKSFSIFKIESSL